MKIDTKKLVSWLILIVLWGGQIWYFFYGLFLPIEFILLALVTLSLAIRIRIGLIALFIILVLGTTGIIGFFPHLHFFGFGIGDIDSKAASVEIKHLGLLIILCYFWRKKLLKIWRATSAEPSEVRAGNFFKRKFASKSDQELEDIVNDHGFYSAEAKSAAQWLLENREET
ncbi:MAG: hypothetical protein AAF544_00995 [Bacteroidota bacterium]